MPKAAIVEVENVVSSVSRRRVDAAKYQAMKEAMKEAMLAVLPKAAPGLPVTEIKAKVLPLLPQDIFPGGDKGGWWIKCVQLDLGAKSILKRTEKPVRVYLA